MREMNNLQKALLMAMETELNQYEKLAESEPDHTFSHSYLRRKKEIIRMANKQTVMLRNGVYRYSTARRVSFKTILVAALIMILATVSVIAIANPHIFYVIKERIDSWRITFDVDTTENAVDTFSAVRPEIPDGFIIEEEEELDFEYYLYLQNDSGEVIQYNQYLPDGLSINIDSERSDNTVEIIDGNEIVVSREGEAIQYIFNDGRYIYHILGTADEELLRGMMESILR